MLQSFWGKAQPRDLRCPKHPLLFHMLDVSACLRVVLGSRSIAMRRAASALALDEDATLQVLSIVAALHDVGKFSAAFQAKAPDHFPRDTFGCDAAQVNVRSEHDADGRMLWEQELGDHVAPLIWQGEREALDLLMAASVAHHGRPVMQQRRGVSVAEVFRPLGTEAAHRAASRLVELLQITPAKSAAQFDQDRVRRATFWFSGLFTISDWTGSNQEWFTYAAPETPLEEYWTLALARAHNAVRKAGLVGAPSASPRPFQQVAHLPVDARPTPLQQRAEHMPLPEGPLLMLIEDATGSGKTEAAQMLTHRLLSEGRAAGAYWGMPTQATANAMYLRQEGMLTELFEDGARPSLVLMHGQARLHERFQNSSPLSAGPDEVRQGALDSDETATAACAAFLAEDRRAALLADVGAGTIDQALLAALPSRFHTVRLLGLADKVLVVDEAHAYDAYMGAEIEGLLRFQAALGGCAIVLSATLPRAHRERFVRAWCEGLGDRPPSGTLTGSEHYPLITVASGSGVGEVPIEAAPSSRRTTPVRFVEDRDDILAALEGAARSGAAVAWVRNTVDDAIAAADDLRARGLQPLLFHARFAQGDRQHIERDVMARLGKDASPEQRRGAIVVATQVIEQSLDLDVDLMASDLAPIDLLIQRAGRLRRHRARDAGRPNVEHALLVLSPPDTDDPAPDWLSGASEWIYKDPAILWRTRRVLGAAREIAAPDMVRALIEAVYAPADEAPEGLRGKSDRADGQARAERSLGQTAIASLSDGYVGEAREWMSEERARTRLGDPETTLRLARVLADGSLGPLFPHHEPRRAWALSEARVRAYRAPPGVEPLPRFHLAAERVRTAWGRREQERADLVVLPLENEGEGLVGRLVGGGREHVYRYLDDRGLTFG